MLLSYQLQKGLPCFSIYFRCHYTQKESLILKRYLSFLLIATYINIICSFNSISMTWLHKRNGQGWIILLQDLTRCKMVKDPGITKLCKINHSSTNQKCSSHPRITLQTLKGKFLGSGIIWIWMASQMDVLICCLVQNVKIKIC